MKLHPGANDLVVEKRRKTDLTQPNLTQNQQYGYRRRVYIDGQDQI